jgi:hypothetical protein
MAPGAGRSSQQKTQLLGLVYMHIETEDKGNVSFGVYGSYVSTPLVDLMI